MGTPLLRANVANPRLGQDGDVFDRYPFNKPANEDFYERYMAGEVKEYQTDWVNPSDYETQESL